jgi:hypothetical protein
MAYIPKSQIKTNLFTNGGELLKLSDNLPYKGYYYKTSQGNFFAGKYPGDGLNFSLILNSYQESITTIPSSLEQQQILQERKNLNFIETYDEYYLSLKDINPQTVRNIPKNIFPTPQPQDYINTSFVRYFAKKRNEEKYLEIDKITYDKLLSQDPTYLFELYKPLKLNWQISGNKSTAYNTNQNQTSLLSRREKLVKFNDYFKNNFTQLYALYTQGNTYVVASNGQSYTGFYHIMEDGQVMTGKNHTNKGINLVLRDDYIEQSSPTLTPSPVVASNLAI